MNAVQLLADDDKAPFSALAAKNIAMGTTSEGDSYDWSIARRQLLTQKSIYRKRGTCPGILDAVRLFTQWDAVCSEVGLKSGCAAGASSLATWDGISERQRRTVVTSNFTINILDTDGTAEIVDSTASWTENQWRGGKLLGPVGDVACIRSDDITVGSVTYLSSGTNYVTTLAPQEVTRTARSITAGNTTIYLNSTLGILPGMSVQVTGSDSGTRLPQAEIFDVKAVTASAGTITLLSGAEHSYLTNAKISIAKSIVRVDYPMTVSFSNGNTSFVYSNADWIESQWGSPDGDDRNYSLDLRDYSVYTAMGNDDDTLTFTPAYVGATATNRKVYLAGDLVGATGHDPTYYVTYQVMNGAHPGFFEPRLDFEERGSIYDPFSRLWQGTGALYGVWGPTDLGIYITSSVLVSFGRPASASGSVLSVDPSSPALVANALVGMWLNPNQNQEQTFEIISNTASTITVAENIEGFIVSDQYYFVMSARNRNRYVRLCGRLRKEYSHQDVRPHVLFV
jgi:hypothetical protein